MAVTRRAALLSLLALAGCSTTQSLSVHERDPRAFAPWSDAPVAYRLGAGDRVKVDFLLTPELAQEAVVEPDGCIGLRVAGRVEVQNLSLGAAQEAVARAAAGRLLHPVVTLSLAEARSARVIVAGAVARPGVYPLPPRASPLEAVALAGGFLPESRMDEVVLLRQRVGAPALLRTVDLRRFVSAGRAKDSAALASEDIVFVPRSHLAEFDLWVDEAINKALPFTRSLDVTNVGAVKP